jgi:DNA (cytosine-5)-methyltransferase 1
VKPFDFFEFFAGGGLARLGLGPNWRCLMANDISLKKGRAYRMNFPPADEFIQEDIAKLTISQLPGTPTLAWASFPCQDLSLAGARNGLEAERSGTFWPFWKLMNAMDGYGRPVPIVVLENVVGALTSNKGRDIQAIIEAVADAGYRIGLLVIDAVHFVPQSRPRLFFVAVKTDQDIPEETVQEGPSRLWHSNALKKAYLNLPGRIKSAWVWWRLPEPPARRICLSDLIEENPVGVRWHEHLETDRILSLMSKANLKKVKEIQESGARVVGTVYKRTRKDESAKNIQRAEVRFDQVSGCLRTPAGGSSRQTILVVEGERITSRLLSPREAARLIGVPDDYQLPSNYNEAYHIMGDGLVVPAVSWIEKHILFPLARTNARLLEAA